MSVNSKKSIPGNAICASLCLILAIVFAILLMQRLPSASSADETDLPETDKTAADITEKCRITVESGMSILSCDEEIQGIYIEWKKVPAEWYATVGESRQTYGQNGFLHEYVEVSATSVSLSVASFKRDAYSYTVYGKGSLPDSVQRWDKPCKKADLMLLSTHADDEHLFFAGILPYYAGEKGYNVQVVYMVDHAKTSKSRPHELLNGLWAVGVRNYPIIGEPPDLYSESLKAGYSAFEKAGYTKDYFTDFLVENIRRFKPLVIVGHDINGEYGHGAHMVYTDALINASKLTANADCNPESAEKYGVYTVPKIYLHLYEENRIIMDWDNIKLEKFGGRTAFRVSVEEGFAEHKSQHYTWFAKWSGYYDTWKVKSAADIEKLPGKPGVYKIVKGEGFSPRIFGLYSSTVGSDVLKNDFFENIDKSLIGDKPVTTTAETTTTAPTTDDKPSVTTGSQQLSSAPASTTKPITTADPADSAGDSGNNTNIIALAAAGSIILVAAFFTLIAFAASKLRGKRR